jgi:exonuclease SbcC
LDQNKCPVCDTEFVNKENLQLAINAKLSTIENDNELKSLIVNKEEELKKEISAVINSCDEYFKVQGDSVVNQDELRKIEMCYKDANLANLIVFLEELGAADEVIRICNDTKDKEERIQIIRDLIINCKKYIPIGYIDLKEKYNYDNISRRYFDDESCLKEIIENQELLESKANFLKYEFEMFKLQQQRNIRDKVVELIKLEKLKNNIDTIGTIYRDEIKKFKKKLIKNIEIPLFIYTGKIIQNYQRGIGVFIKTNNDYEKIKFVPDNNTEHDIINTFSSGQLSGFVIAFMLVMNKIYNNVNRNFNTILIDDPVQTMDDINIASFVEILRNEFKDYQIILSTHEVDKANYIRYKFHKYGIDTSNYNVKEQIFSI